MSKVFVTEGEAVEIANEGAVTYTSYVNETASQGNSDLTITTKIDGRNDQPQSFDIDFIRRNDWLQIPVNVTDADIVIEFDQQHMPIGGLPRSIHFPSGPIVPQGAYETDHAGDITITYRLTNVSSFTSPVFKHYKDNFVGSEIYSSAVLLTNGEESEHTNLLINTPKDNTYAPWLDKSKKLLNYRRRTRRRFFQGHRPRAIHRGGSDYPINLGYRRARSPNKWKSGNRPTLHHNPKK